MILLSLLASVALASEAPKIESLLKPEVLKRVKAEREVRTYAKLENERYHFYAAMSVRSSIATARETLTTYSLYQEMVPFVSRSEKQGDLMRIEGGIFGWKLASSVRIETVNPQWLRYRIVEGHLRGLSGRVLFERSGERETVVYFDGELTGKNWPPTVVMERGAEIVFGLTADRMRNLIEKREHHGESKEGESARKNGENKKEDGIPQPRKGPL